MADKLTLRGIKRIEKYVLPSNIADREFTLKRPTTGKDQFTLKRWWTEQGNRNPKRYVNATCLDVANFRGSAVVLAVVGSQDTRLDINLNDAQDTLTFGETHAVERVAVFSTDFATLHYDYVIPRIAGGRVATLTINAIAIPTTIGNVTRTGGTLTPSAGDTVSYTFSHDGTATGVSYALSSDQAGDSISGLDVTFDAGGSGNTSVITVTATDAGASDSPDVTTFSVSVS